MATITGTSGNDNLNGTAIADIINGLAGNDTLNGFGGDDSLNGGTGADRLFGGDGNDTLFAGAGNDIQEGGFGNDTYIVSELDYFDTIFDAGGVDTFVSTASWDLADGWENLVGRAGGMVYSGSAGNNVLTSELTEGETATFNGLGGQDT